MSIEESSNLSNIDDDDFSDDIEMENELESAFGDEFLEQIMQSEKYVGMIEKQQMHGVKMQRMKVTFAQEIKVKAFNDYFNSMFLSREQLSKMLRQEQIDFIKHDIVSYFLNNPQLHSTLFSSVRELKREYVITQAVVDEAINYIRAILRAGKKLSEGLSIAIELNPESDCVQISEQLMLMMQTHENMLAEFQSVEEHAFFETLDHLLTNSYEEVLEASLLSILICYSKTRNDRLRAFFSGYKLYQQGVHSYFPQEIRLLINELLLYTDSDTLTEKCEKLKIKLAQIVETKQQTDAFIERLENEVDGMIAGKEAAEFTYLEFNELLSATDKECLDVFVADQKGEPQEGFCELLPYLVKRRYDWLVGICEQRDVTDDFIEEISNQAVRQIVESCIEQFREEDFLLQNEADIEKRYVALLRSTDFGAQSEQVEEVCERVAELVIADGDKSYDDELVMTENKELIRYEMDLSLRVQMRKIKASFFIFFSKCINENHEFNAAADYSDISKEISIYRKYISIYQFAVRFLEVYEIFKRLLQDPETPEEVRNIIDHDFDLTISQQRERFADTGYICQYDEWASQRSENPRERGENKLTTLFSEIVSANPILLKQFTLKSLETATLTTSDEALIMKLSQLTQDEQNERVRRLYEEIKAGTPLDLEALHLHTDDIVTSAIYSPNDPFWQIAFLSDKPLLLYHREYARGLNKTEFLYIKHIYDAAQRGTGSASLKVRFSNVMRPNFDEFSQYDISNSSQLIEQFLEDNIIVCINEILEESALSNLFLQVFQYFSARFSEPRFNPFVLQQSSDTDPKTLSCPFVSDSKVERQDQLVFTAAEKAFRICTVIPMNLLQETVDEVTRRTQTTFVVTDNYGRYIDSMSLKAYETPMPNPFRLSNAFDYRSEIISIMRGSGVTNGEDFTENCKLEREKLNNVLQAFFSELTQTQIERVLDEAELMDFLAKNAVCAVGVLEESFNGHLLKEQLSDTLSYLNEPFPSYYNEQDLSLKRECIADYTRFVYCPLAGEKAIIGRNILFLDDFIYKRVRLAPHIAKIIVVDIQGDIPLYLLKNGSCFDISMDKIKEGISDMDAKNYLSITSEYLFNNIDAAVIEQSKALHEKHFGSINYLWESDLLMYTSKFQLSSLRYDDMEEPPFKEFKSRQNANYYELQKSFFSGQTPPKVSAEREISVVLGIIAARYLLDPMSIICQLTLADAQPDNLLRCNLFGFLPDFMPFHASNSLETELCNDEAQFYDSLKFKFTGLLTYTQELAVMRENYDFNMAMIAPHFAYAVALLPGLSLRKLGIIWRQLEYYNVEERHNAKSKAKEFTQLNLKDVESICVITEEREQLESLLAEDNKSELQGKLLKSIKQLIQTCDNDIENMIEKIKGCTDFNMFGEPIGRATNEEGNVRFIKNKNQLMSVILQVMFTEQLYYRMMVSLFDDNPDVKDLCEELLNSQNFGKLRYNPLSLRDKFGYTACDDKKYLFALMISSKLEIPLNVSIGALASEYFTEDDYKLLCDAASNIYSDMFGCLTITPDVLMAYPGSPYATPLNVSYAQEYKHPITSIAIHCVNYYIANFEFTQYQFSPAFKITSNALRDFEGDKAWKSVISTSFNEFGSRYSYNPESYDGEKKKKELTTRYNCQLINDSVLNSLTLYERLPLTKHEYRCICFILLLIDYFNTKSVRNDIYDSVETSQEFIEEQENLLAFYKHFKVQEHELPNVEQEIKDYTYSTMLYTLFGGQQMLLLGLYDAEVSFDMERHDSQISGIYRYFRPLLVDLLERQPNFVLTVENAKEVFLACQDKVRPEDNELEQLEEMYYSQISSSESFGTESFELEKFLATIKQMHQFGYYNIQEKAENLVEKGTLASLLEDKFLTKANDRGQLRRFLKVVIDQLKQADPRVDRLFASFRALDATPRGADALELCFDYVQRYKSEERVISKQQLLERAVFKQDPQFLFLLQSKEPNAKFFERFEELQVEIPYAKRQIYANQKESTSFDVNCVNIPGLKGSIPSGGKENEVDLSGPFTAYLDGIDFENCQIFLRTYITVRPEQSAPVNLDHDLESAGGADQKINISNIIQNIRENEWRSNLLEAFITNEASYIDNPVTIGENFKGIIPTAFGRENYSAKHFNQSAAQLEAQVLKSRPEPLKKADLEKYKRPVERLEQLCLQKLVLSYSLVDFYIANNPGDSTQSEEVLHYHSCAFMQSLGLKHYISTMLSTRVLGDNEEGLYALVAQFEPFLLKQSVLGFEQIISSPHELRRRFIDNFEQLQGFKQSPLDIENPAVREEVERCVRLIYYWKFTALKSFIDLARICASLRALEAERYLRRYKNEMQAAFQRTEFRRQIDHPHFEALKVDQVNDYFTKNKNEMCVFIPAPGTYSYIYLAVQTPRADANGAKYALFRIYEDEQAKPVENNEIMQQKLSTMLYIDKFEHFPDIRPLRINFATLDDIMELFVRPLQRQYRELLRSAKFVSYTDRAQYNREVVLKSDFACYFSDCKASKLTFMKYSPNYDTSAEHVYLLYDGVVFRNKFIGLESFMEQFAVKWVRDNWRTFEVNNKRSNVTLYRENAEQDEE